VPSEETTAAIVLRASNYGEADRIVTLLTRDRGKLAGIARGIRKSRGRFERRLEPFAHVWLSFRWRRHGELVFITRAEAGNLAAFELGADLRKFALGAYMLELSEALTREGAQSIGAYELLAQALDTLCRSDCPNALKQVFELKMLRWAGYGIDFSRCRGCGCDIGRDDARVAFAINEGGLLCERCRRGRVWGMVLLERPSVLQLQRLDALSLEASGTEPPATPEASTSLNRFISFVLERNLRSLEFLQRTIPNI